MRKLFLVLFCIAYTSHAGSKKAKQQAKDADATKFQQALQHMNRGGGRLPKGLKVMVATPAYGGMVAVQYALSLVKMLTVLKEVTWDFQLTGGASIVTIGRNNLVMTFLESDCTHMLFLDADMHVEPETLRGLLALDEDVALAPYPTKSFNEARMQKTAARTGNEARLRDGLWFNLHVKSEKFVEAMTNSSQYLEVDAGPTGCMLIKRGVFDKMIDAYPDLHAKLAGTQDGGRMKYDKWWRFFDTMVDEKNNYLGEDIAFCRRWRAIGGKIWADMHAVLTHVGMQAYTGSLADFLLT